MADVTANTLEQPSVRSIESLATSAVDHTDLLLLSILKQVNVQQKGRINAPIEQYILSSTID